MGYTVKETYYTLQGEGVQTGCAAVFLRFTGCNLWSGREEDRDRGRGGCARWCDTDFVGVDGVGGGRFADADGLAAHVAAQWHQGVAAHGASADDVQAVTSSSGDRTKLVVCTGGEPLLQLDAPLISALHAQGFRVAIETNGTCPIPGGVDWVCVSPKAGTELVVQGGDELKLVFPQQGMDPSIFESLAFRHFALQPLDSSDAALRREHLARTIRYCLAHPRWRLSLQTHKALGLP